MAEKKKWKILRTVIMVDGQVSKDTFELRLNIPMSNGDDYNSYVADIKAEDMIPLRDALNEKIDEMSHE